MASHSDLDRPAIRGFSVLSYNSAGARSCLAACISFFFFFSHTARTFDVHGERMRFDSQPSLSWSASLFSPRALLPQWVRSSLGSCIDTCDTRLFPGQANHAGDGACYPVYCFSALPVLLPRSALFFFCWPDTAGPRRADGELCRHCILCAVKPTARMLFNKTIKPKLLGAYSVAS